MKSSVSVKFVDFWPTFDHENNVFVRALRAARHVDVLPADGPERPDLLFYSRCGAGEHYRYNDCIKIYFTGENDFPDLNECDYALSFYDCDFDGRMLRYPLYMLYEVDQAAAAVAPADAASRSFASLVMSNATNCDPRRLAVIDAVESYRPVAYGGSFRNNVGGPVADKIEFISGYKFNLALENSLARGYVTEKIIEPFAASTVPIYWGDDMVRTDFNPEAFLNVNDYVNTDSFIRALREVDTDPVRYMGMLTAPKYAAETAARLNEQLSDFLNRIADTRRKIVHPYGEMGNRLMRNSVAVPLWANRLTRRGATAMSVLFGVRR